MDASPTLLVATSTARTSSVSSSIPICILRQTRRLGPPCLRAYHSPSPSDLMPVLSMSRFSGPKPPRYGRFTFSILWRRHWVLKSGIAQSRSMSRSRLSTPTVVCRSGKPNSSFNVRQAWIAVSLKRCWRPRFPDGGWIYIVSGSNQSFGTSLRDALPVNGSRAILAASMHHCRKTSSSSCNL